MSSRASSRRRTRAACDRSASSDRSRAARLRKLSNSAARRRCRSRSCVELVLEPADGLRIRLHRQAAPPPRNSGWRVGLARGGLRGHVGGRQVGAIGARAGRGGRIGHAAAGVRAVGVGGVFAAKSTLISHLRPRGFESLAGKIISRRRAGRPVTEPLRKSPQQQVQRRLRRPRRMSCRVPGSSDRWPVTSPTYATAYQTVPTGFASVPPPGPAMPVTATATSTPSRSTAPRAIASATGSLTAPCSAISAGSTPSSES